MIDRPPRTRWIALGVALTCLTLLVLALADRDGRAEAGPHQRPTAARANGGRRSHRATPATRGTVHVGRPATAAPPPATVGVVWPTAVRSIPVPKAFLGLSTEYWTLPIWASHRALLDRALALIHVPGDTKQVLRIGGDSADHTFWDTGHRRLPHWAFAVGPAWVKFAAELVRRERLHLILDLNLITGSSPKAAEWARVAERDLPRRSIVGFEIGNEPDIYDRWVWLQILGQRSPAGAVLLPRHISPAMYLADFRSYAHALVHVAPQIPLVGPALANPQTNLNWLAGLITGAHAGLGLVSAHRYPYSACGRRTARSYPSIAKVLSDTASVGVAQSVAPSVRLAERSGLPFRLTELNSVTCGGVGGISDSFATALWAPDTLFALMNAGVDGANVHVRAYAVNAAFALTSAGFHARPLMYGLILFRRTIGPGARLVPLGVRAPQGSHLKAWGVQLRSGRLHVLLINKGSRSVRVRLLLPAVEPATVQRLIAPSASAQEGMTLGGRRLGAAGQWVGRSLATTIAPADGRYTVDVPAASAALLAVKPA